MRRLFLLGSALALVGGCGTSTSGATDAAEPDLAMQLVPAACANGVLDGDETDVDCGGTCAACGTGKGCKAGKDCQSTFCTNKKCDCLVQ